MNKLEAINEAEKSAKILGITHSVLRQNRNFSVVKGRHDDAIYDTNKGWISA